MAHYTHQLAMTPEALPVTHAVSFRAPPPSPVAPGRRSPFSNEAVLTEYLEQSLKVPDLILPDRVFPKQKSVQNPPKIDLQNLGSPGNYSGEVISDLVAQTGCLEVINHGISPDLIKLVLFLAAGIFEISPEKKRTAARSPERQYGFEEFHGDDEIRDESEEFLWCRDESMILEMEKVWPFGYSNFSQVMEKLQSEIEEVGSKILQFLEQHSMKKLCPENNSSEDQELAGNFCRIQKHCRKTDDEASENSLKYDVIRMLIKGSEFGHALCLHICSGSTDFHVYSKKGWLSFCPNQDSIVITVGDKLQAWSDGQYKHVIGRPVFKGKDERCISMGFLFSSPNLKNSIKDDKLVTISLNQQIIFAILITITYQFLFFIYCFLYKRHK
ncbi:hypothetical protein CASFOL_024920 [Castilleja foliolosa]|uniref:Non-haem dioxygenase N-terminal domain-containing protein n=1 Tax=Castilleja foliolosa TaxID=1961234 RepID=A0ABD3CRJ9_9LAMI